MRLLVLLILKDDDAETDVTSGDQERRASNTDETQLPGEDKTDDETADESGDSLNDTEDDVDQ